VIEKLRIGSVKKVSEVCERDGEGGRLARVAGFPAAAPGWDFGGRGVGRRARCLPAHPISRAVPVQVSATRRALKDLVRIAAFPSRLGGVVPMPNRRSQRICGPRSAHDRKALAVQRFGRCAAKRFGPGAGPDYLRLSPLAHAQEGFAFLKNQD
jgi:hypothetical protein